MVNRLSTSKDNYNLSLVPDPRSKGIVQINGLKFEVQWQRPIPADATLMKKMTDECFFLGRILLERGEIPSKILSIGMPETHLTYTYYIPQNMEDVEYLLKMTPSNQGFLMGGRYYGYHWEVRPEILQRDKARKLLIEANRTGEELIRLHNRLPKEITAYSKLESDLVYSRAE
ncbi:MAG: hypothetical protein AABX10_05375 [Nanoarchaeota archaeon]